MTFLPVSGQEFARWSWLTHHGPVTRPASARDEALIAHLVATTGLSEADAERVVDDVLGHHVEQVGDYVRRRHRTLKTRGLRNEEIYRRLADEVAVRVFAAPPLSERQVRRLIYG